jgi:hypothetical protein
VDGLSSFTMEPNMEVEIARNLGMGDITFFSQVGYGGGAACATVGHAAMAVAIRPVPSPWWHGVPASVGADSSALGGGERAVPGPGSGRGRSGCSDRSTRSRC